MSQIALILSGGGARGAYQAGVVQGIYEVLKSASIPMRIDHFSGVSAGAINASYLASLWEDKEIALKNLVDLWSQLKSSDIYYTDAISLGKIGLKWVSDLSLGGATGTSKEGRALLDTEPLKHLLHSRLDMHKIGVNLDKNLFRSLIITAVDYYDSTAVSFIQTNKEFKPWRKQRRVSEEAKIIVDHVLGSSAIPLLFPPRPIENRFFGDGCVRNSHPCAPSIYLGAQKLLVIGVKSRANKGYSKDTNSMGHPPSVARVVNLLMNAVLLDNVEHDIERLIRMNQIVTQVDNSQNLSYKKLDFVFISPSRDIGALASKHISKVPRIIRYLIKGLGSLEDANELVSYLLFESPFCSELIEMGFQDALDAKEKIIALFRDDKNQIST
ncbi:MAG: patatin-like phospholipase family protein [Bdellovibrionaceae bacterium]|nr:patatin-like phospholipase family protein [Pseudobdellovibrionaceae bacterium]